MYTRRGGLQFLRIRKNPKDIVRMKNSVHKKGEVTVGFAAAEKNNTASNTHTFHNCTRNPSSRSNNSSKNFQNSHSQHQKIIDGNAPEIGVIPPSPDRSLENLGDKNSHHYQKKHNSNSHNMNQKLNSSSRQDSLENVDEVTSTHNPRDHQNNRESISSDHPIQSLPFTTMTNKGNYEEDFSDNMISQIYEGCCYKLTSIIFLVCMMAILFMVASRRENFNICSAEKFKLDQEFKNFDIIQFKRYVKKEYLNSNQNEKIKDNTVLITQIKCQPGKFLHFKTKGYYEPPIFFDKINKKLLTPRARQHDAILIPEAGVSDSSSQLERNSQEISRSGDLATNSHSNPIPSTLHINTTLTFKHNNDKNSFISSKDHTYPINKVPYTYDFSFWPKDMMAVKPRLTGAEILCRKGHGKENFEVILMNKTKIQEIEYIFISEKLMIEDVMCGYGRFGNETESGD